MPILSSGLLADRPAAGTAGNLYLPTDSVYIQLDTGAAWSSWGLLSQWQDPPDSGNFSWVNQGAATLSTAAGILSLYIAGEATTNLHLMVKAAPATPYTITACFANIFRWNVDSEAGLCFRDSASGKIATFATFGNSGYLLIIRKYTDTTTYSADYGSRLTVAASRLIFLRIQDDGANRISSYSLDGQNWITLHTVGRTDFLTADQVGFFVAAGRVDTPARTTLLSWKEA